MNNNINDYILIHRRDLEQFRKMEETLERVSAFLDQYEITIIEEMNREQAAKMLRLKKSTLTSYICADKIPYVRKASKVYFLRSELSRWLREGKSDELAQQIMAERCEKAVS